MKVVFATPTLDRPYQPYLDALEASVPILDAAGIEHQTVFEVGNAYISAARATMLRKALDAKADAVVFIDHDLSWRPEDLLTLIQANAEVCAGTYRFKEPKVEFMGMIHVDDRGIPVVRDDGLISATRVPGGFLKITKEAVAHFMRTYPELIYGEPYHPHVDLFNHGVHQGVWWGEDYAFSRRWCESGKPLYIVPDLTLTHHTKTEGFTGNYHEWLMSRPGGSKALKEAA